MTRLTLTALLALAVLLAGCSTAAGPTPTPQERTVIVERTAPTPEVVERTVIKHRTIKVFVNRTVTVIKPSPTRLPSPTAHPSPTRRPSPTAHPSPTPRVVTKTVIVTKTVEVTPTASSTPTPVPPDENDINLGWDESVESGVYTVDVQARNFYDGPVDLTLGIVLYADHQSSVYSETRRNAHFDGPDVGWTFTVTYDGDRVGDVERAEVFVIEVERV
jgi:hypothetical protein